MQMMEVACAVCGAVYRFAPGDIPPGGKTVSCAACKARIGIPGASGGGAGDKIDLADLPAPKRISSPPRPPDGGSPPRPEMDSIDLPPPRGAVPSGLSTTDLGLDLPAPKGPPPARGVEPLTLDSIDLLAPVGPTGRTGPMVGPPAVGAPPDRRPAFGDNLLVPKRASDLPELPAPKRASDLPELPAPKRASVPEVPGARRGADLPDLPAPKRASDLPELPAPKRASVPNLPAPKRASGAPDLPAPKRGADLPDLPAPKRATSAKPGDLFDDLPAPEGPTLADMLPAPKGPSPTPGEIAPKGFFDDLPQPKGPAATPHEIAPKGFFDDLPQPKGPTATLHEIAPKGFFDDLPQAKGPPAGAELAPKGFFDDLPQAKGPPAGAELAPKGFFDDLPQAKGPAPAADPSPKGFFDDLPQPRGPAPVLDDIIAPAGFFDDLPQRKPAPPPAPSSPPVVTRPAPPSVPPPVATPPVSRHSEPAGSRPGPLDLDGLDLASPIGSPAIELESNAATTRTSIRQAEHSDPPSLELGDNDALPGLDLSPSSARGGVVSFKPATDEPLDTARPLTTADPAALDLAGPPRRDPPAKPLARPVGPAVSTTDPAKPEKAPKKGRSPRLMRVLLAAAVALAGVGTGGFYLYRRHAAAEQRTVDIARGLRVSRDAMLAGDRQHWVRAIAAARGVLAKDPKHAEAAGLVAEALLAQSLDEGLDRERRVKEARSVLDPVRSAAPRFPAIERAATLDLLVDGDADASSKRLEALVAKRDLGAILYLGWAQLAGGQWDAAIASFERAQKETPKRPVPALYGLARAQLGKGDRAAARASFLALIELDKDHVGALVGEAEAMPAGDFVQREAAVLAILQRKDIAKANPAVIARAWTIAGDDARRAGRLDAARERYRKALALAPSDVATLVSSAALELRDNKLDAAATVSDSALGLAPADPGANLIAAELDIRRNRLPEAAARLTTLRDRTPPLAGEQLGRLHLLDGMRLEATDQFEPALGAYDQAVKSLGESEVAPVVAAATLLGRMASQAEATKDPDKAKALRARADEKLGRLASAADADPSVAVTLGVAYLSAGAPVQGEAWLRKALARRPRDVEAHFQLAEALRRQGKQDEAIATLVKAFELDPSRIDLGVELARSFEAAGRDADASALYKRLLDGRDVSMDVRVRAGRFFARIRDLDAARAQGEKILEVDPESAAGLFLRAESLLADGRPAEARRLFKKAVDGDPDPQYLDGLGRAGEAESATSGDTVQRDDALLAYIQASEQAPTMLNPVLGRARLHLARREYPKALAAYQAAQKIAPNDPVIPYGIGVAYDELEDREEATRWLSRAVAAQPRADAYYRLGTLHYEANRPGPSAAALSMATQLGLKEERDKGVNVPWLTNAYWLLGAAELARRNDRAVVRAWEAYLERGPTDKVQASEVRRELMGLRGR